MEKFVKKEIAPSSRQKTGNELEEELTRLLDRKFLDFR
jgi:hypothetical protein